MSLPLGPPAIRQLISPARMTSEDEDGQLESVVVRTDDLDLDETCADADSVDSWSEYYPSSHNHRYPCRPSILPPAPPPPPPPPPHRYPCRPSILPPHRYPCHPSILPPPSIFPPPSILTPPSIFPPSSILPPHRYPCRPSILPPHRYPCLPSIFPPPSILPPHRYPCRPSTLPPSPPSILPPSPTPSPPSMLPPWGRTENGSLTLLSSGNPCLDFFFHVVPDTPSRQLIQRLELAWGSNPLMALKLIFHLRGVRGTGKSDKEGFFTAALWLHDRHPKTLACNARVLAVFGCFKDLLEILYRLLEGPEVRNLQKEALSERNNWKRGLGRGGRRTNSKFGIYRWDRPWEEFSQEHYEKEKKEFVPSEKPKELRKERAKRGLERYSTDSNYRFLHDQISDFFSEVLRADVQHLASGEVGNISLAAKWCPTIGSSYDNSTSICESIARKLYPREEYPEYQGIEEGHYVYRIRDRLRRQVLVPLRKALELPEVYMCANRWESLPYNRVASVAMKTYTKLFKKHDKERFGEYLDKVKKGEATIAAGALLPHEIIASLGNESGEEVAELQWARMVGDLAKKGKLNNCIAVCDVSGSMSGTPMEVSVALGLLTSELSEDPWKGHVITFSADPQLHKIQGETLVAKTQFVRNMDWGGNTDFQKVFDRILQVAAEGNLSEDQMIKRVFVFSDMEFDQARGHAGYYYYGGRKEEEDNQWGTDYQIIKSKFEEKGYSKVPELVFWNLRNSPATPVPATENGVALVSGYSKNMMTLFLEEGVILTPEDVMNSAVSGEEYRKLVIFD